MDDVKTSAIMQAPRESGVRAMEAPAADTKPPSGAYLVRKGQAKKHG